MKHTTPDGRIIDLHTEEVGYGAAPPEDDPIARDLAGHLRMSPRNVRKAAVGHVWCSQCQRELLAILKVGDRFLGLPGGNRVDAMVRADDSDAAGYRRESAFFFGDRPSIALACRCWPAQAVHFMDLRVLALRLNSGEGSDFRVGPFDAPWSS